MDMRFGTWNVISLYGAGLCITAAKEISKYKSDLVGAWVRWGRNGTEPAGEYTFSIKRGTRIMN
jgi:hypothetical protein